VKIFFHTGIGLLLVVMQTTALPALGLSGFCYDLLIPFVIHLGRTFSLRLGFPLALGLGLLCDSLSAGAFGIYTTAYFWTLMLVFWLLTFLHARSSLIWPFIVAIGVLLENGVILAASVLAQRAPAMLAPAIHLVLMQFILAVFTGPLILRFFRWLGQRFTAAPRPGVARDES